MKKSKPKYEHDCDACKFLGTYTHNDHIHDLYFCGTHEDGTVIARFGHDGPEYRSGMPFAERGTQPYKDAKDRAVAKGFYKPDDLLLRIPNDQQIMAARADGDLENLFMTFFRFEFEREKHPVELFGQLVKRRIDNQKYGMSDDSDEPVEVAKLEVLKSIARFVEAVQNV